MTQMSTETIIEIETVVDLSELVDMEVPCDYSDRHWCGQGPARWVGFVSHECGYESQRLLDDQCKNNLLVTEAAFQCRQCGAIIFPARHVFHRIEAL